MLHDHVVGKMGCRSATFVARSDFSDVEVLGNHLLALLDLTQDAIRPNARLDVADLLTQALGVSMPRRSDFMAGRTS